MATGSGDTAVPKRGRPYLKLVIALCCIAAIGLAASTYDSTLDTDPDDVIDVKHTWIPLGKETILALQDRQPSSPKQGQSSGGGSAGGGGGGGGGSGGASASESSPPDEPAPCTTGLAGVLATVFPSLIPPCGTLYLFGLLLPFLLLLTVPALVYRYRARLLAPVLAVMGVLGDRAATDGDEEAVPWPSEQPGNAVQSAWLSMVMRTDIDRPWTRTPAECARAAVDAGMNAEAVETITTLFEEVRYGGAPLTDDRRQRARDWHQRLTDGRGQRMTDGRGDPRADGGSERPVDHSGDRIADGRGGPP